MLFRSPNTGGMGAFAPLGVDDALVDVTMTTIIEPTMRELRRRQIDYRGVLYAGLMVTPRGPKLLEYNVRFGDPETEVIVPLMGRGLFDVLDATARGSVPAQPINEHGACVTVVLAADGYPQSPRLGDVITGLGSDGQLATPRDGVTVFHAGTRQRPSGEFETAGGRVLAVTAVAERRSIARRLAYDAAQQISFAGMVMRTDIAEKG